MNLAEIAAITRQFLLTSHTNVRAVRIVDVRPVFSRRGRTAYSVLCSVQVSRTHAAPGFAEHSKVEVLVAQDGTILSVQGRRWDSHQQGPQRLDVRRHVKRRR